MIIVTGSIRVAAADRELFLTRSREAIQLARTTPGCQDFVVAADPLNPERVNIYERWTDPAVMQSFRGSGPSEELNTLIISADVHEYTVVPTHPGA